MDKEKATQILLNNLDGQGACRTTTNQIHDGKRESVE